MIHSLAPATYTPYSVSHDRRWVYYTSSPPSQGIYRVPYVGGTPRR